MLDAEALAKQTRPPRRFTEATLLTAMETAGKALEEKELSDAMKDRGLGTPATRAAIIETLLRREYIRRNGKMLEATDKGIGLIEVVHPVVKSPAMTGEWEAKLKGMERGDGSFQPFMHGIEEYVREVVGVVPESGAWPSPPQPSGPAPAKVAPANGAGAANGSGTPKGPGAPKPRRSEPIPTGLFPETRTAPPRAASHHAADSQQAASRQASVSVSRLRPRKRVEPLRLEPVRRPAYSRRRVRPAPAKHPPRIGPRMRRRRGRAWT